MTISEWCKLKREYASLSEEEFALKAWKMQREQIRNTIMQQEQERFEEVAAKKIEQEIDKNIDKAIEKALLGGKYNMDIKINI